MSVSAYSEDQRDCLQEICNVAMGQAADALARAHGQFVHLSIPVIKIVKADEFSSSLSRYQFEDHVYAASQLFSAGDTDSELSGLSIVILSDKSLRDLKALVVEPVSEQELIVTTCKTLAQTCLDALSEQWGLGFQCQLPELINSYRIGMICDSLATSWQQLLMVEINYQMEGRDFSGDLLLLFPNEAIGAMAARLDALLL